ncbi:hypothetical protein CPB85DRAFT_1438962 [Mucidula mucida]|nr:hypothetical protein CPB85DRAFT_1438962 [Mucidula mucida]
MGGSLRLKHIRIGEEDPEDFETDEVFEEEVEGIDTWWEYRYSGFHWFKGKVLRGGIAYLAHFQTIAAEKELSPEGAKQLFLAAGIKAVIDTKDNEAATKGASVVIGRALQVLNGWTREERSTRGDPFALLAALNGGGGGMDIEALIDVPYHLVKINGLAECPIALERVGMRGLYLLMRMSDNNQVVYHEAAQMMASVVERVMEQGKAALAEAEAEDLDCFEEMSTGFISATTFSGGFMAGRD